MKKIFWTSIVWIGIVILFRAYVKLFNNNLGQTVSNWIYQEHTVLVTGSNETPEDMVIINDKLTQINDKLSNILQTLTPQGDATTVSSAPSAGFPTTLPIVK